LNHQNIIKIIEYLDDINYCKKNGKTYKVTSFVLEFATNGDLHEIISQGLRFEEPMARKIFQQLLETIEHCHSKKFAHRDLKLDNILFDKDYNLKLADFGFSVALTSDFGTKDYSMFLGTESFMAPELHKRMPYCPAQTDLYALAIILFIINAGSPPFKKADESDPYFKLFMRKPDLFWKAHEKNKPKVDGKSFFSEEFKALLNAMFALDSTKRPDINAIKSSDWYQGSVPSLSELQTEIKKFRDVVVKSKINERVNEKEEMKIEEAVETKKETSQEASSLKTISDNTTVYIQKKTEEDEGDFMNQSESFIGKVNQVKVTS